MSNEQIVQMQQLLQKSLIKIKTLEAALENKAKDTKVVSESTVTNKEPIAIIGCGVRLPGEINSTKKLWELLIQKKSAVKEIPKDRFDIDAVYNPDGNTPGKTNARFGAFLENDIRAFDASFFSISPREAKSLDPLQRMVLEVVYEAFETAGIASESIKGSKTGVYIALGNSDYITARLRSGNLESVDIYDTTGVLFGTAGGRVSFLYDFCGPSYNVDAACASTILAVHLAKQDLQNNTIDLAVVASANLLLTPEMFVGLSKLGSISSTNQCKAFANDCDGYIRGEGCGVVLLKRLKDAEDNNDTIELIIRSSSVRHNGKSNGFTAPNPDIIVTTIKEALEEAHLSPEAIDYVEAHGIGNRFTDAVEVQSIHEGYKQRNTPIYVGSVKANIGHLEAGTGMPMLFKIIESFKHRQIPAQINISALNEDVDWDAVRVKIPLESTELNPDKTKPLYAAINLSGYSGTNVHMIFESPQQRTKSDDADAPYHFILSAKDETTLKNSVQKYVEEESWLENNTLSEICYTLQTGRNHYDYAIDIMANTKEDIFAGLSDYLEGLHSERYAISKPESNRSNEVAFLFTGQGAQYFGMCKNYYQQFEAFRSAVDTCDESLKSFLGVSIKEILWGELTDKNLIHQTRYTQPALFVVEYALAKLWMSKGVTPSVLIGHSIGEIVALTIAEAISLKDALQIVVARAALMQSLPVNEGGMASVFCGEELLLPLLENSAIDLAAVNSIKNCTISGKKEAVQSFIELLKEKNIKAVSLNVSHAFHSALMEPIVEKFVKVLNTFSFHSPKFPVVSNLTGKEIQAEDLSPEYFAQHIRNAVQFSKGINYITENLGISVLLEIGPTPVLINLAKQNNTNVNTLFLSSAKREDDDLIHFHRSLQQLYTAGIKVNWNSFYVGKRINRVALPTYGWNKKVYWESPLFASTPALKSTSKGTNQKQSSSSATAVSQNATRETLLAYMQIEAAKVLGLEAGQKVDINKTYREQGFDSMMSGEFLLLMEKHIGAELKMELLQQYNTPTELHRYLIDTYFGGGEIDTSQAITMADIMFNQEMENQFQGDWHEIKPEDGVLLKWFKKWDKKIPSVK